MSKHLKVGFKSGIVHELDVNEAEFHIYPVLIPEGEVGEGEPHPNAGDISGYKIDTSNSKDAEVVWFKISEIESIVISSNPELNTDAP
jgi:hypothetical protein